MNIIQNIISRLFLAIVPSFLWTFSSLLIMHGLYNIKKKEIPEEYLNMFSYIFMSNYILTVILLILFFKEDINFF